MEAYLYGTTSAYNSYFRSTTPEERVSNPTAESDPSRGNAVFGQMARITGRKHYELNDHLGNVLSTISDHRIGVGSSITADYYTADVRSAQDYYPFGMLMPGRHWGGDYQFGYQSQEKDNEIKGEANSLNYKYRMDDPRLGRFQAVDPLAAKFAWNSPYAFSENRVIDGIDLEGKEHEQYLMRQIVANQGVGALKIISLSNGYGPVLNATYNLQTKSTQEAFNNLKTAYTTDPGILHNPHNMWANYKPLEDPNDNDNRLGVGDHMYIRILGGTFKDYVRFTDVKVSENSFSIKAATLYGHTDAGTIEFSGTFDPKTNMINFSINNETTTNTGLDYAGGAPGRFAQKSQWEQVLQNVQDFVKGNVQSKALTQVIYQQGAKAGDVQKIVEENLQTGEKTESYSTKK